MGYKRSKKLVMPKVQLALVMSAMLLLIISSLVFYGVVVVIFLRLKEIGASTGLADTHQYFVEIAHLEHVTAIVYGGILIVSLFAVFWGGLRLSNKIVGPMYRLNAHMQSILSGEASEGGVRFREGDFLMEVEANFNKMMQYLREENFNKDDTIEKEIKS